MNKNDDKYFCKRTLTQYKEMIVVHRNHPRLVLEQVSIGLKTHEFVKTPQWEMALSGMCVYPKTRRPLMFAVAQYFYGFENIVKDILSTPFVNLSSSMQGFSLLWAHRWGEMVGGSEANINVELKFGTITDMYFEVLQGYAELKFALQGQSVNLPITKRLFAGEQLKQFILGYKVYRRE